MIPNGELFPLRKPRRQLGETIPLGKVSSGVFLDLYRTGKTTSDPFTACELVFGSVKPDLVREAQTLMNHIDRQ